MAGEHIKQVGGKECHVIKEETHWVDINSDGWVEPMVVTQYQEDVCGDAMDGRNIQLFIHDDDGQLFELERVREILTQGQLERSVALFKTSAIDDGNRISAASREGEAPLQTAVETTFPGGFHARVEEFYFAIVLLDHGQEDSSDLFGARISALVSTLAGDEGERIGFMYDLSAKEFADVMFAL